MVNEKYPNGVTLSCFKHTFSNVFSCKTVIGLQESELLGRTDGKYKFIHFTNPSYLTINLDTNTVETGIENAFCFDYYDIDGQQFRLECSPSKQRQNSRFALLRQHHPDIVKYY